ncbi:MAG: glycerate kinase [Actinomycetota bacterium]|nr:glycerate kinase [Actinomycetota bacterium]
MATTRTVLLAPDKFKGCLAAIDVCAELRSGLLQGPTALNVELRPIGDGGEGTLDAAVASGFRPLTVTAAGPLTEARSVRIGIRGSTALVELAEICGLARLPEGQRSPMRSSTYGVGVAMRAAIQFGCRELVIGIGGSASTDGGMGVAAALGARILDQHGQPVRPCGAGLRDVASVDFEPMLAVLDGVSLVVATDVDSPLTGKHGAARVFAPQKGANAAQIAALEAGLENWAERLIAAAGVDVRSLPAAGAAGGFLAPLLATDCVRVVSGGQYVLELTGTGQAIADADAVVTGEGSWDVQTSTGKAPQAVVAAARAAGKPVIAVAGRFSDDADLTGITACYSLTGSAGDDRDPIDDARVLLREIGARIAEDLRQAATTDEKS